MLVIAVLLFASQPVVQFAPAYPRDGQPVAIMWTQTVAGTVRFGTPSVAISPDPFGFDWSYGGPHVVTISQTATVDGSSGESTDRETAYLPPVVAGSYTITLELAAGADKQTFPMGEFVVAPACSADPSASATYSWEKHGYELNFNDSINYAVFAGNATSVAIEGNHVTIHASLTIGGIPTTRPLCISKTVDLGSIAPGTYHLTWIYDELLAPKTALAMPTLTRELTFEAQLPRRRTSHR